MFLGEFRITLEGWRDPIDDQEQDEFMETALFNKFPIQKKDKKNTENEQDEKSPTRKSKIKAKEKQQETKIPFETEHTKKTEEIKLDEILTTEAKEQKKGGNTLSKILTQEAEEGLSTNTMRKIEGYQWVHKGNVLVLEGKYQRY